MSVFQEKRTERTAEVVGSALIIILEFIPTTRLSFARDDYKAMPCFFPIPSAARFNIVLARRGGGRKRIVVTCHSSLSTTLLEDVTMTR